MDLIQTKRALTEEDAARMLDGGAWWPRVRLGMGAGLRLLLNPRDTQQVFLIAASVDRSTLARNYERLSSTPAGRALLRNRPAIDRSGVDYDALRALPEDTLGGAYARMLTREQLDPDLFGAPPGLPEELAFVAQRMRQTHDLWHVLTGLGTDIPGEVALQAFMREQTQSRMAWLLVHFGLLFYGRSFPQMRELVREYRALGRRAAYLLEVPWEELWEDKLTDLRARLLLRGRSD